MTSDQERTCDALSLFHGGWAVVKDVSEDYPEKMRPVYRCETAGDQPNYLVFADGSVSYPTSPLTVGIMNAAEVQEAVYALTGLAG